MQDQRSVDEMEEVDIENSEGPSKPETRAKKKKIKSAYKTVSREIRQAKSSRMYVFNFFLFACAGCLLPFLPIFFKLLGFSTLQNGILVSSRGLVTFWSSPLMSSIHHLAVFTNAAVFVCVVGFVIDTFSLALVQDGFRGGLAVNKSLCPKRAKPDKMAINRSTSLHKRNFGRDDELPDLLELEKGFTKIRRSLRSAWKDIETSSNSEDTKPSYDRIPRNWRTRWDDKNFEPDDEENNDDWNQERIKHARPRRKRRKHHMRRKKHRLKRKGHRNAARMHSKGHQRVSRRRHVLSRTHNGIKLPTEEIPPTVHEKLKQTTSNSESVANNTSLLQGVTPTTQFTVDLRSTYTKQVTRTKHHASKSHHKPNHNVAIKSTIKTITSTLPAPVRKLPANSLPVNGNVSNNLLQRVTKQVLSNFPMPKIFFAILVITLLSELFYSILCYKSELVDEVGRYFCPSVFAMNRLWGRIGYCMAAFASAYVTWRLTCSYTASNTFYFHFYGFVAVGGCVLLASLCLPLKKRPRKAPCKDCCTPWRLVLCNLQAFTFSVSLIVMGMADVVADAYILWYTHELGGTEIIFGSMITIAVMTDVLFYCFLGISIQWVGHSGLLTFAILVSGAQFVAIPYIHNVWVLIPTQVLRGVATAASRTAIFDFSNAISPLGLENSVHSLFQSVYSGLGVGIGGLYLAVVCSFYGLNKLFQGMAVVCFIYGTIYCLVSLIQFTMTHGRASGPEYEKVQPDVIPENDWLVEALEESERTTQVSKG